MISSESRKKPPLPCESGRYTTPEGAGVPGAAGAEGCNACKSPRRTLCKSHVPIVLSARWSLVSRCSTRKAVRSGRLTTIKDVEISYAVSRRRQGADDDRLGRLGALAGCVQQR